MLGSICLRPKSKTTRAGAGRLITWAARKSAVSSADPLSVEALAIATGDELHLLVANLTPHEQQARVTPLPDGESQRRRLHVETAPAAMADPRGYRAGMTRARITDGTLDLTLAPYEVVRIDTPRSA